MPNANRRLLSNNALAMLALVGQSRRGLTRAEFGERVGFSRATVGQRLSELLESRFVVETEENQAARGRPTRRVQLNPRGGLIATADIGEVRTRFGIFDLKPELLAEVRLERDLDATPTQALRSIAETFDGLIAELGRDRKELIGAGLSLRAPVNFASGFLLGPSVMAGWDNFDIRGTLADHLGVPCVIENDVNLLALAELALSEDGAKQIAFVKVGTGIGCGIIADGKLFRGANGVSGDIGHIQLTGEISTLCRCGKLGCVEAQAAGWAIARDLREAGFEVAGVREVVELLKQNVPEATQLVRRAGRIVGEVVADLVSILNPDQIVVGGVLADTNDHLLSGVREMVNQRCLPLATQDLEILQSRGSPEAGTFGAALLVRNSIFSGAELPATTVRVLNVLRAGGRAKPR